MGRDYAWELRYCEEIIQASDGVAMFNGRGKKWEYRIDSLITSLLI